MNDGNKRDILDEVSPPGEGKAQLAYRWISDRISDRRFGPGHRLVLSQIANEIGTSVVPVREALRRLQAEGLVVFERHVGAHVAMVDPAEYLEVMQALSITEAAATALAAPLFDADDLANATRINDEMAALLHSVDTFDPETFTRLNREFHEAMYSPCPNRFLLEQVRSTWTRLDATRASTFSFIPGRASASVAEHAEILTLLSTNAPGSQIEAAVRAHRAATVGDFRKHQQQS